MTFNFGQLPGYRPPPELILRGDTVIGTACTTPIGFVHVELDIDDADEQIIQEVIKTWKPVTFAVNQPSKECFERLRTMGFILRPELVRWFAQVGPKKNPWLYLSPKRAKKIRANIRKARSYIDIIREPLTIDNLKRWLPIYEIEVVSRPGGVRIFYCDIFLSEKKLTDLDMVSCFRKSDGVFVGGCIVNPWGSFSDIEGSQKKYTSFLMSALRSETRPFSVGYLLDEVVMNIARLNGCLIYGHGGDMNFWGTDLLPGLLSRKSAAGMLPVPEGKMQAFLIVDPQKAQTPDGECFLMGLADNALMHTFFEKRTHHWKGVVQDLFEPVWRSADDLKKVSESMVIHHFGKEKSHIQLPEQMKIVEHFQEF